MQIGGCEDMQDKLSAVKDITRIFLNDSKDEDGS